MVATNIFISLGALGIVPVMLLASVAFEEVGPEAYLAQKGQVTQLAAETPAHAHTRIERAGDGLFYVDAMLPTGSVKLVVDTGASVVVLTKPDAERLGVTVRAERETRLHTVGGTVTMRWGRVGQLEVAGHRLNDLEVAVVDSGLKSSLLGQNAIAKLPALHIEGDMLTIGNGGS